MRVKQKLTWTQWIIKVDDLIFDTCPTDIALPLLPEHTYKGWYDQGLTPRQAAKRAIRQAV